MKKSLLLVGCLALLAATPGAAISFDLYGSYWDTADVGSSAGVGGRLGFNIVPTLGIQVGVTYFDKLDQVDFLADFVPVPFDGKLDVLPVDLGIRWDWGRPNGFYFLGGGTYYRLDSDFGSLDDEVGYYGGIGWLLGRHLFVEGSYRWAEGTVKSINIGDFEYELTRDVNVDLGGWQFNVGFHW